MKKIFFIVCLIFISTFSWSQNVEIIKRIPFGTEGAFNYSASWDENEGSAPELSVLASFENMMILFDGKNYYELNLISKKLKKKLTLKNNAPYTGTQIYGNLSDGFLYGNVGAGAGQNEDYLIIYHKGNEYKIENKTSLFPYGIYDYASFLCLDDTVFFMTTGKTLVCIQLKKDGTYTVKNERETSEYLNNGMAEKLGFIFTRNKKGNISRICIGDYSLNRSSDGINYWKRRNDTFQIMNPQYQDKKNIDSFSQNPGFPVYTLTGADANGFHYFMRFDSENGRFSNDNPGFSVKFSIAVLAPFNSKLYIYEDYKENEWNPVRNKDGKPNCKTSFYVAPDGSIYFSDCNAKNKEWLIKKIPNRLYDQPDVDISHIGIIINNNIPLYENANSSSAANGKNYENDIVLQKETKGNWSKIQKLDGREGWVETKFINFDNQQSTSFTNVAVNKIMSCNDNLRLRSEEATSSNVITTMQKGTKVKILKLGKAETIDGINSNWVQVEVLSDAKNKDGKEIKSGTIGWCYGGYLE